MSRERKLPAVPAISSKVPREIAQVLGPLKQIVEALQQGGVVSASSTAASGSSTAGSALPEAVVEALIDSTTPPAPTGVAAQGGMALIIVSFDKPGYRNHAHTEVWRANSNDFSQAALVGVTQSTVYTDSVGGSRVAWYWLRHVSSSTPPRPGPFNSQTGTRGETGQDATYVLDLVKGKLQDVHIAQVAAAKVTGTLKDWQIEAVNASKIAGQLADAQLSSISTAKLLGQIEMTQLAGAVQGNISSAIQTANQALTTANGAATATSVNQVNARMAPGGDIYGALVSKAAQTALDAAVTRIAAAETSVAGKASASELQQLSVRVSGATKSIFVPGDAATFYPVAIYAAGSTGAVTRSWRISRPAVHEDGSWTGSYVADVTVRASDWGNAPGALISVHQRTGSGNYTWGLGDVRPSYYTAMTVIYLRGGMRHTVELMGPPTEIVVVMPGADGVLWTKSGTESFATVTSAQARLAAYLNKDWRPDGTLAKESVELFPQALNDISAQNTRLTTAEALIGTKASASTVETLQAQVNRRKNYRVTTWGNSYDYRYGTELGGLYASDGARLSAYHRSYVVVRFGADGSVVSSTAFDVFGSGFLWGNGGAAEMAAHLNALPLGTLVLIYTCDEPADGRIAGGLPEAIYRCGGTAAVFSAGGGGGFFTRSVYVLLGKISGKQGTAFEAYRGDSVNDPAAYLSISFDIANGEFVGISPSATTSAGAVLNRVAQVEATVAGKASAADMTSLQARVGSAEASITTTSQAVASLDGKVSGKWGVAIEATLPDGRKKLSGLQAFNDGSTATFAITADQLLVQSTGSALNADPAFTDRSAWQTNSGTWNTASITDGAVGTTALRSAPKAEIVGVRPQPFDPKKTYRIHGWARGVGGANGQLFLGLQLLDGSGNNLSGNGSYWYTTISSVGTTWTEFNGTIGPSAPLVSPIAARSFRPIALVNYGGTTGYMELQDFRVEEVIPGTLIKPGEITTAHLVAQAVTAEKLAAYSVDAQHLRAGAIVADKLAAGAVTAASIKAGEIQTVHFAPQSITAEKIAAGAITADKLNVGSLSAISANIGTLRTATSGARMEIESNQLRVYDANNVLRVVLGIF